MLNTNYTSGMNETYDDNSVAQSLCHFEAREMIITSLNNYLVNFTDEEFVIGVFGCGPGDNDLNCIKKYILPLLANRVKIIKIYMIDVSENKWSKQKMVEENNVKIYGIKSDIYKNIFPNNFFNMIMSFSCLHWIKKLPFSSSELHDSYSWSSLNDKNKIKLNDYMNSSLKLFLNLRKDELKENGFAILTFDAIKKNQLHQYQGPTDILVKAIKKLDCESLKLFENFFIPTAPRHLDDVKNLLIEDFKVNNILVKNLKCPIWQNRIKDCDNKIIEKDADLKYAKLIVDSIMSCVLPLLKDIIKIDNFEDLIKEIENNMINIIINKLDMSTSTSGNVMFLNISK